MIGVLTHALKWDHDIFVNFERIGMACDRGGACTIQPEFFTCIRADRDKTLAMTRIGEANDFARCMRDRRIIVSDNIADQHHLGQHTALAFCRVPYRAQIALIKVL